jgi:hypothetical protein
MLNFTFSGPHYFLHIQELTLENCHSLRVDKFWAFLAFLPELRYLTLRDIFKEQPVGCSRYNFYITFIFSSFVNGIFKGILCLRNIFLIVKKCQRHN